MTRNAQVCPGRRGVRSLRRGASIWSILAMILMIVAAIGLGIWAMVAYNGYKADAPVVAKVKELAVTNSWAESELSVARAASAQASWPVGAGPGAAGAAMLLSMLDRYSNESASYSTPLEGAETSARPPRKPSNELEDLAEFKAQAQDGRYKTASVKSLKDLINAQDDQLTRLVSAVQRWLAFTKNEIKKTEEARAEYLATVTKSAEEGADAVKKENAAIVGLFDPSADASQTQSSGINKLAADASAASVAASTALDSQGNVLKDTAKDIAVARAKVPAAVVDANEAREQASIVTTRIGTAVAKTYTIIGTVREVDPASGYVWISIGQKAGVRAEDVFEVWRPTPDGQSSINMGLIRAKAVGYEGSKCRTDLPPAPGTEFRNGDYLTRAAFPLREYKVFAFAGAFGRETQLTRQQLSEVLLNLNKTVLSGVKDPNFLQVEIVILGDKFQEDPVYTTLKTGKTPFETMTEREFLYMFGGPAR